MALDSPSPPPTSEEELRRENARNPLYVGKVPYRGEQSDGVHQGIVDSETWARVQDALAQRVVPVRWHLRRRWGFLLGGLVRCGLCGGAMTHHFTARGTRRYSYYVCQTRQQRGRVECAGCRVRVRALEDVVIGRLLDLGHDADLIAAANETEGPDEDAGRDATEESQRLLSSLGTTWGGCSTAERQRILSLLIDQVTFDGPDEVAVTSGRAAFVSW